MSQTQKQSLVSDHNLCSIIVMRNGKKRKKASKSTHVIFFFAWFIFYELACLQDIGALCLLLIAKRLRKLRATLSWLCKLETNEI